DAHEPVVMETLGEPGLAIEHCAHTCDVALGLLGLLAKHVELPRDTAEHGWTPCRGWKTDGARETLLGVTYLVRAVVH
ncbi:MAG TPA: hypothetical protein VLC93_08710, partial [Myxococcota bacterium]|nr:hypothetical protein [Myxococcota bacterium]